ncbi:MAG: methionyl-tRNA formyltransferase [Sphaerochaetaceae bacterium]|nr:methionyl-tRNA formyltransferase [Sphaerochaetaceae bacterium]
MRILFAGTAEIGVQTLRELSKNFEIGLVLTNPDRPKGRSKKLVPSPIKEEATALNIPILQPERLRGDVLKEVASYNCDVLICFAYGKIFGPKFLSMFSGGCYNIHPSRLPQFRGSSPIQYAILKNLRQTAITIQKLSLEVDSGDILAVKDLDLEENETTLSLTNKVATLSAPFAVDTFLKLKNGEITFVPQTGEISYTEQFKKEDAFIDWNKSASEISAQIRAFIPWPKACTRYGDKVLFLTGVNSVIEDTFDTPGLVVEKRKKQGIVIACREGSIIIDRLQLQGKKELDFTSFLNGNSKIISTKLG